MNPSPAWTQPATAIVTGGGSGIGLAVAQRLSTEGAAVAVFDIDAAVAAAEKIGADGGRATGCLVDVTDRAQIDAAVSKVCETLGPPTILVNSAGLDGFERFLDISAESWARILAVNLTVNRSGFDAGFIVEASPAGTSGCERSRRLRILRAERSRAGCAVGGC
jgi:2-hydroxycyclohexanecarboxyl-CoA dehydrogenase